MNKRKTFLFFLILLILYFFNLFGRFYGLYMNFVVTGVINFIFTYYLLKINPFKKVGLFLIFFPFILLSLAVAYGIINSERMPGIIGYYMYLLSTAFGIILYRSSKMIVISCIYLLLFTVSVLNYQNMFNYYYSIVDKNINVGKVVPKIEIIDKNGTKQLLKNNGKILVVDLWSNTCGNCIKAFPKFEKIKNDYKNDNEVAFLAINIYNKKSDILESEKYLKKYSFNNFYSDTLLFNKLNFNTVPNYMIIGKDEKIKYFGNLNVESIETYNNMYKLIENEK
ncbi:TlpA family protein disulfide reductase [Flavobacterium sp.]|uniref:TlpA family protein disulfide reductase n=1 Tax=Flavobacterium sp. TaxID=239 RepID=UPI0037C0F964